MKPKILYEVDPYNRLIVKEGKKSSNIKRFRQVISGRFKTDGKNKLYYETARPFRADTPQKIKFSGNYAFNGKHNLIFSLSRQDGQKRRQPLRLRTRLVHADGHELVFLLQSKSPKNRKSAYIMKLDGSWQVDKNNRLRFGIDRGNKKIDRLVFFNAWRIGKHNEIIYNLDGRHSLVLKGDWQISKRCRLAYSLDKDISPALNFTASAGQIVSKNRNAYIKFDVEIKLSKTKSIKRSIAFSCKLKPSTGTETVLKLSPSNKDLNLKFTKEILDKTGLAYIESFIKEKERYIGGGLALRW